MIFAQMGLMVSALFTGAALYINVVEHPARASLAPPAQLREWKPAYKRGFALQAPLAALGLLLGAAAFFATGQWRFLAAGVLLGANWPFTLIAIMPTNRRLMAMSEAEAGPDSARLIDNWAQLHTVRTGLGAVSTLVFFWALLR